MSTCQHTLSVQVNFVSGSLVQIFPSRQKQRCFFWFFFQFFVKGHSLRCGRLHGKLEHAHMIMEGGVLFWPVAALDSMFSTGEQKRTKWNGHFEGWDVDAWTSEEEMVRPALCCLSAGPFCSGGRRASDWRVVTRHILSPVSSLSSPSRLNTNHLPPQRVRGYPSQPFTAWQTSAPHVSQPRLEIVRFLFLFDVCQEFLKAEARNTLCFERLVWYVGWKHGGPVGWHVPCGSSLATASPPTKPRRLVSSDNLRPGGRMQAGISIGGCWRISPPPFEGKQSGEHVLGVQMSPACIQLLQ